MTDLEAIGLLQERARSISSKFYVLGGFATLGTALLLFGAMVAVQWAMFDVASVKVAALVAVLASVAVVPAVFNAALKRVLAARRLLWIDELARNEGANRQTLIDSFTLDSH